MVERSGLLMAAVLLVSSGVGAEELARLEANRPDFTETVSIVAPGHLQVEGGASFGRSEASGSTSREQTYPELLLRYGVAEPLELQLGWGGYSRNNDGSGSNDMSLALKYRLYEATDSRYAFDLLLGSSLPSGSGEFSSDAYDPLVSFVWAVGLNEALSLSGSFVANWYSERDAQTKQQGRHLRHIASLSLGIDVSEDVGAFLEWVSFDPDENGSQRGQYASTGMTYYLSNDLSIDGYLSKGLNDIATDWRGGVGFARRF